MEDMGYSVIEFEVTNVREVSEFEVVFTRDSIIKWDYIDPQSIWENYCTVAKHYIENKILTGKELTSTEVSQLVWTGVDININQIDSVVISEGRWDITEKVIFKINGRYFSIYYLRGKTGKSCGCVNSWGEKVIAKILTENNIQFKKQYTFKDLKNKGFLRFDFAIFNKLGELLFLIEFDGRQHYFGPDAKWKETDAFEEIKYRDNLKNEYCRNNHIKLKRIPYTKIKDIKIDNLLDSTWDI